MTSPSATALPMTLRFAPHERQKRCSDEDSVPHFGQYIKVLCSGGIYESLAQEVRCLLFPAQRYLSQGCRKERLYTKTFSMRMCLRKIVLDKNTWIKANV